MSFVGVIKANQIHYSEHDLLHVNFTNEKICDQLDELISMKTVNTNELMQCIFSTLFADLSETINNIETESDNKYKNFAIHTGIVSHTYNDMYQICHLYITKETFEEMKTNNLKVK